MMRVAFLLIILLTALMAVYYARIGGVRMLRFFIILVVFQNIIGILFCRFIPALYYTFFSIIKELMLYLSLGIECIKNKRYRIPRKRLGYVFVFSLFAISLMKNVLVTPAAISSAVLSLRYMLVPILCIYVGKTIRMTAIQERHFMEEVVHWSVFLALFGFLEMIFLRDVFWRVLGYSEYAVKMKGNLPWTLYNGVTMNYYTWDFFGMPLRRLVSITADPLATAYLVFLGAMILFTGVIPIEPIGKAGKRKLMLCALLLAAVLSLSKAVLVMAMITILVCAYSYKWIPRVILRIASVFLVLVSAILLKNYLSNVGQATSISNHFSGLINGVRSSGLLGNGLGTAGSSVVMLTGAESDIAESYLGAMISQIGIIGTVCFSFLFLYQIKRVFYLFRTHRNAVSVLAVCSAIGVFVCMLFSDSSVSIMGTGLYFIVIGLAQQQNGYEIGLTEG